MRALEPAEALPLRLRRIMTAQELSQATSPPPSPINPPALGGLNALTARIETSVLHRILVVGALGILIMLGLFLANYSPRWADWYWSAMFPVFGLVCLTHQLAAGDTHGLPACRWG